MDQAEAKRVLGVPPEAQFHEIRSRFRSLAKRFHPDNPTTGDPRQFSLISSAYVVLQGQDFGLAERAEDVSDVLNLKIEIDDYLDELLVGYQRLSKSLLKEVTSYTKEQIYSADSSTEVRRRIEGSIARNLVDARTQLEYYVKKMAARARTLEGDFLFDLFGAMYRERRRYWLLNLYRNPILIAQVLGLAAVYLVRNLPTIPDAVSLIAAPTPWIPFLIVAIGGSALLIQYLLLNPKRQYVPPAASLPSLYTIVREHAQSVGTTSGELAAGGAFGGAVLGSIVLPGIGTLVGAGLGALLGLAGESLDQIKRKTFESLMKEFKRSLRAVDRALAGWVESAKVDLHRAAVESFAANSRRIAGLLESKKLPQRLLTSGNR